MVLLYFKGVRWIYTISCSRVY